MQVPIINSTALISDNPRIAAAVSCAVARKGTYFPVLDGPRLARPDRQAELVRRTNTLARLEARRVMLSGLPDEATAHLQAALPKRITTVLPADLDPTEWLPEDLAHRKPVTWGTKSIGVGMLTAMRRQTWIQFKDTGPTRAYIPPIGSHLVVCEVHDELSEVIAANYAFALDAGLQMIAPIPEQVADALLERLYGILDRQEQSPADVMRGVIAEIRDLVGPIDLPPGGSITWISRRLPLGLAYPELPSSHLFTYPDLGLVVANGLAAEQEGTRGLNVAVLIDPGTTQAPEIMATARTLAERRILVRSMHGPAANVTAVSQTVDHFPYDLLMFSTHCGDVSGYRWTYQFDDSEGLPRRLVVDIAVGVGKPTEEDDDRLLVTEMTYHRSLDGVDWADPHKADKLYVGTAIKDFHDQKKDLTPVLREEIDRVHGSSALMMHDHNYIPVPQALAAQNTPIIFNNACTSWRELCLRFMFGGARAYIGTVVPVMDVEATEVANSVFKKHYGKPLGHALWAAQNDLYGDGVRRPYVVSGVYPQRLRTTRQDTPSVVFKTLETQLAAWTDMANAAAAKGDRKAADRCNTIARYYRDEVSNWPLRRRGP